MTRTPANTDAPIGEVASGLGLFLSVLAVIALAVGLAGLTLGHATFAAIGGVIAVVSFAGSLACFIADTRRFEVLGS